MHPILAWAVEKVAQLCKSTTVLTCSVVNDLRDTLVAQRTLSFDSPPESIGTLLWLGRPSDIRDQDIQLVYFHNNSDYNHLLLS